MEGRMADESCLDLIFRNARTHNAWLDKPVSDDTLRQLYDAMKWGPTSANANPARFVFLRTKQAKERLRPSLAPGNVEKTMTAPVVVIVAYDLKFYEKLPRLFPHSPNMRNLLGRECEGCDQEFFPEGHVKSNFLCNIGYGEPATLFPRSPRLAFEEACTLL